jgi:hypothetical protein
MKHRGREREREREREKCSNMLTANLNIHCLYVILFSEPFDNNLLMLYHLTPNNLGPYFLKTTIFFYITTEL